MTKLIITGANGKMGKVIKSIVENRDDCEIIAGVDLNTDDNGAFPIYSSINDIKESADAIIDFSNPVLLNDLLSYSEKTSTPLVIATTGYSDEQKKQIAQASKTTPIFFTYNMSMGVNLLANLAKKAVEVLGDDFDIEIVEKHHNQKIDAPSGTAKLLYEVMEDEIQGTTPVYDRSSLHEKRKKEEIGIQALRGGTIFGEHEIMFAGLDEIIEIKHTALSKDVFVQGALAAAKALQDKEAGLFTLKTLY